MVTVAVGRSDEQFCFLSGHPQTVHDFYLYEWSQGEKKGSCMFVMDSWKSWQVKNNNAVKMETARLSIAVLVHCECVAVLGLVIV